VVVDPVELELDPPSRAEVARGPERKRDGNLEVLHAFAARSPRPGRRRIVLRFLVSPVEILGSERVTGLTIERNELYRAEDGTLRPRAVEARETLGCDLIFRAIGYQGVPLPGVPFDPWAGRIPNEGGRVLDPARGGPIPGEYVVGWIKRGPQGIIGTNKPDSQETVEALLDDLATGRLAKPGVPGRGVLESLLHERKRDFVSYEDWQLIDQMEQERGREAGQPRLKFSRVEEMLHALGERKEALRGQEGEPTSDAGSGSASS
jgi:ferredoxin/flavodoxin---NADP+ reductase